MNAAGIFDEDVDSLKFPDWLPAGLGKARAAQLCSLFEAPAVDDPAYSLLELKPTYRELRVMQKYVTEDARALTVRSKKQGRVPALKFGSNDGWIVTPEECLIIAYRLRSYLAKESPAGNDDPEWVDAFAAFNEVAAKYGLTPPSCS